MGIIKDILDVAKSSDVQNTLKGVTDYNKISSLSKTASEGILQFPVLVPRSIDIDTLQMICKSLERNYSTFAQVAISMNSTMNISKERTPAEFISKFHQNSRSGLRDADIISAIDDIRGVADSYNIFENDNYVILAATYEGASGTMVAKNKSQLLDMLTQVRTDTLNNKFKPKTEVTYNFKNKELSAKYNSIVKEANEDDVDYDALRFNRDTEKFDYQRSMDREKMDLERMKTARSISAADEKNEIERQKLLYQSSKDERVFRTKYDDAILAQNMLKDNDVKKSNELMATTLHIRVKQVNSKDESVGVIDFIVGIKATMHPIKTSEMISNMVAACGNNNKAFNFFRWTTGEIGFFKDFLLNINEMKTDVASKSAGASPWWITLKRRKALAKLKDNMFIGKRLLPNATIVISAEEVEYIKSVYGYDLFNPIFINKIMSTYFLLGFVIVDRSAQIAHFMFDGRNDFESVSFSGLEKENTTNERKFKEMLKAINRN